MFVNRLSHRFFPSTTFAIDQNTDIGRANAFDLIAQTLHRHRFPNQAHVAGRAKMWPHFLFQLQHAKLVTNGAQQLSIRDRRSKKVDTEVNDKLANGI